MLPGNIRANGYSFKPQWRYHIGARSGIGVVDSGRLALCAPDESHSSCLFKFRFCARSSLFDFCGNFLGERILHTILSAPSLIHRNLFHGEQRGFPLFGEHSTIFAIGPSAQLESPAHLARLTDVFFCMVSLAALLIRCAGVIQETVET
jgi:hypothetical protein